MELIPLLDTLSKHPVYDTDSLKPLQFSACERRMWFHHRNVSQFKADTRLVLLDNSIRQIVIHALKATGRVIGPAKHEWIMRHDEGFTLLCIHPMRGDEYTRNFNRLDDAIEFDALHRLDTSSELSSRGNRLNHAIVIGVHRGSMAMFEANIWHDDDRLSMFRAMMQSAETAETIPDMVPDKYCNDCDYVDFCNRNAIPRATCRTCANVTNVGGQFECRYGSIVCDKHIYHPQFMALAGYDVVAADPDRMVIDYGDFCNAPEGVKVDGKATMTSRELAKACREDWMQDDRFLAVMGAFNARLEL